MSLKVALLTATLSPRAGGLGTSVPALAYGIAARGADIHVLGLTDPTCPALATLWGPSVQAVEVAYFQSFGYAPEYASVLNALSPQVTDVQGLWMYPSLVNLRYHSQTGTPYLVTPRGMLDPWALSHSSWKKQLVRLWFEDRHLKTAACLRATAEMEASHFRRVGLTNPVAIVPNSIEVPPSVSKRHRSQRRNLLFLSRIHPKKGLSFLLKAWQRVAKLRPDWDLLIAGPDERGHLADMKKLADEFRLKRVSWLGEVYGEQQSELYWSSDLFVLPTHAENFGLVVAEALAHAVPVITTRNAPWSGLVANRCGWWINLTDETVLDTILAATSLPRDALHDMGCRGRAWMERDFGGDSVAAQMLEVYEWVIHGGRRPDCVVK